jgi:hypothetical protein
VGLVVGVGVGVFVGLGEVLVEELGRDVGVRAGTGLPLGEVVCDGVVPVVVDELAVGDVRAVGLAEADPLGVTDADPVGWVLITVEPLDESFGANRLATAVGRLAQGLAALSRTPWAGLVPAAPAPVSTTASTTRRPSAAVCARLSISSVRSRLAWCETCRLCPACLIW